MVGGSGDVVRLENGVVVVLLILFLREIELLLAMLLLFCRSKMDPLLEICSFSKMASHPSSSRTLLRFSKLDPPLPN